MCIKSPPAGLVYMFMTPCYAGCILLAGFLWDKVKCVTLWNLFVYFVALTKKFSTHSVQLQILPGGLCELLKYVLDWSVVWLVMHAWCITSFVAL